MLKECRPGPFRHLPSRDTDTLHHRRKGQSHREAAELVRQLVHQKDNTHDLQKQAEWQELAASGPEGANTRHHTDNGAIAPPASKTRKPLRPWRSEGGWSC